jgi:hypothetical protein
MGELFSDERGTTLPDHGAARKVALEVLADLVRDAADILCRGETFRVVVEDEWRIPLFTLDVTARAGNPDRPDDAAEPNSTELEVRSSDAHARAS